MTSQLVQASRAAAASPPPRDLTAAPTSLDIGAVSGGKTEVLAYDGTVPGPLLRLRRGQEAAIRLLNKLTTPTSLHWHGMRIVNAVDGVVGLTGAAIAPGGSSLIRVTPPDAGLYWYHPCRPEDAELQSASGLCGAVIVEDEAPPTVDLDLLLTLRDWLLDQNGHPQPDGATAVPSVNGKPLPHAPITLPAGGRLRLRLLNASEGRIVTVGLDDLAARIIAVDGQPCELLPVSRGALPIGPGARFELLADLPDSPDRSIRLTYGTRDLLTFRTAGKRGLRLPPIAALPPNPLLPTRIALERAHRADLALRVRPPGHTAPPFPGPPLFSVTRQRPVTLTVRNTTAGVQQIRLHGHVFRVLHDLDDGWDPYWRDSLLLGPGKTKHIAFVADNPGRWLIEAARINDPLATLPTFFEVG